jgi:hypothetical protein
MGAGGEDRRGHGVAHHGVRLPFATAGHPADHREVRRDQVDRPAAAEPLGQPGDQAADVVGVRLVGLGGGQLVHLGGAHGVPLRQERQGDQPPALPGRGLAGDQVLGGGVADRAAQGDAGRVRPRAQRVQGRAVVVVAADRHHDGAGGAQRGERPGDHPGRVRRRGGGVVEVARHDDQVGPLGPGDVDHLGEHRDVLLQPRLSLEDLADVPVGRVQDLQRATS